MPTPTSCPSSSLKSSIDNLRRSLRNLRIFQDFDYSGMLQGNVEPLYTIIRFLLVDYEPVITNFLVNEKYEILGQSNTRLLESWFKILRQVLNYRPTISIAQFNSRSFMIKKVEIIIYFLKQLPDLTQRIRKGIVSTKQSSKPIIYSLSRRNSLCESFTGSLNNDKASVRSNEFSHASNQRNRRSRSSSETRHFEDSKFKESSNNSHFRHPELTEKKSLSRVQSRSHPKLDTTGAISPNTKMDEIYNRFASASSTNMHGHSSTTNTNGKCHHNHHQERDTITPVTSKVPVKKTLAKPSTNQTKSEQGDAEKLSALTEMISQLARKVEAISARMINMEMTVERLSYENEILNSSQHHNQRASNYYHLVKENTITSPKFYTSYEDMNNNEYLPKGLTKSNYYPLKSSLNEGQSLISNANSQAVDSSILKSPLLPSNNNNNNGTKRNNTTSQPETTTSPCSNKPPLPMSLVNNNNTSFGGVYTSGGGGLVPNNYRYDDFSTKSDTAAYQAQVDRISSMLAETQSILEPTIARARKSISEVE